MNEFSGNSFDSFLEQEELLEEITLRAQKRALALQVADIMKETGLTKSEVAARMGTSRSQLDRLLDPDMTTVTLESLARLAQAIGRHLKIEFA